MYHNPVKVVETNNWIEECSNFQVKLGIQNPLVITSYGNFKRLNLSSIFDPESIFSDVRSNPTFESCQTAIDFCDLSRFDGIIAIGGGSVMDTAKVVMAFMGTGIYDLDELLKITIPYEHRAPSIFIPSTHGTGSEVTMWGTVWNMKEEKKYSIVHPDLYPSLAILDGNLTLSLPLVISLTTIMDALTHSFEAIWNKNANANSTAYAIEAISLILKNVLGLKNNLHDVKIRNKLLKAANKAGLAFSNTKTAAAHALSYPLTIKHNIPHGIACSIFITPLLIYNEMMIDIELKQILDNIKRKNTSELINDIKSIPRGIIKYSLSEYGVEKKDLKYIIHKASVEDKLKNNIIDIPEKDISKILYSVW